MIADTEDNRLLKDNERLHQELLAMMRRKERRSEVTFAGDDRHTVKDQTDESRRGISSRDGSREPKAYERPQLKSRERGEKVHVQREIPQDRIRQQPREVVVAREADNQKLRETLDALEYMKKRERALQEEVKSLSQVLVK